MKSKSERQRAVLEEISKYAIPTQAELHRRLLRRGIRVNQATLSRDIRQLGLVKVSRADGSFRYAPAADLSPGVRPAPASALGRLVREVETSRNLVVVKTQPGDASRLGVAIDGLRWREVVGTVAGDDTLLVVVRDRVPARSVAKRIAEWGH